MQLSLFNTGKPKKRKKTKTCRSRVKCAGLKKDGTLKKGYKFLKGGAIKKITKKTK
ncbi:MAG: hypothetical protein K0B10_07145 [Vicingaceae bacterium]|nr:hypothetical protein [Vicingaceae bacterium]